MAAIALWAASTEKKRRKGVMPIASSARENNNIERRFRIVKTVSGDGVTAYGDNGEGMAAGRTARHRGRQKNNIAHLVVKRRRKYRISLIWQYKSVSALFGALKEHMNGRKIWRRGVGIWWQRNVKAKNRCHRLMSCIGIMSLSSSGN